MSIVSTARVSYSLPTPTSPCFGPIDLPLSDDHGLPGGGSWDSSTDK